jgi:hypothetical protein
LESKKLGRSRFYFLNVYFEKYIFDYKKYLLQKGIQFNFFLLSVSIKKVVLGQDEKSFFNEINLHCL